MIDVVIPSHRKDIDTLDLCIEGIRDNVEDVGRIIVVSKEKLTENAEFYCEEKFPFSFKDVGDIIGFHRKTFNYYAGLIQTTAAVEVPDLNRDVLICDADTIFLSETKFIDNNDIALYNVSYDVPSEISHHPYFEHHEKLIPGLVKQTKYSGICHHMLMQQDILREMIGLVEKIHGVPFWQADISVMLQKYKSVPQKKKFSDIPNMPLLMTVYELYFNYVNKYHPDRVSIRKPRSILAYKGRMGVVGEELHDQRVGSRTNLQGNVQILPVDEENKFQFDSFKDSCKYIAKRCKDLGWDAVTFQNHTRIGSENHRGNCEAEISKM